MYSLCANGTFTLALASAWRGVGNNYNTKKNAVQSDKLWGLSRYLLVSNDIITLALACAWRENRSTTI